MDELSKIPGVGPKTLLKLQSLGINSPTDLIYHFPNRYLDFSNITKINQLTENNSVTITGKIIAFQNIFTRSHKNIQKAKVQDSTGIIDLIWFNQPYLSKNFKIGDIYSFAGTVSLFQNKKTIISPEYGQYNTGKIIPIYPETSGINSKWLRKIIQTQINSILLTIKETYSPELLKKFNLLGLNNSLLQIHFPQNQKMLDQARYRLSIDEIISLQAQSFLNRQNWLQKKPNINLQTSLKIDQKLTKFIKSLPFKLTDSQLQVWQEIKTDLISPVKVSNRLLQGDVGSGKTVIAMLACYLTHLNNSLSLIIAPTEILAQQHFQSFQTFFSTLKIPILLLTGTQKIDFNKIKPNSIIISTHAAIYQKTQFQTDIGLLIIDEQHKFGVKQRSFLNSSLNSPHCLTMTATPIPRTISLTLLGNLDLSTIDTLPQNRVPIKTFLVPQPKIAKCYDWIETEIIKEKVQAFIVCPFIDISESMNSVKSAIKEFENLSQNIFPKLKLGLIHGRMKPEARQKVIDQFKQNKIHILVTTPIIEVGIDIPNASIIIIQSADRFGLAQLHQLRGRVGRGHQQSYCYLFTESENDKAVKRLEFLEKNINGLKIAEYDLATRGPGEAFSTIQHGFPSLKIANFSDLKLIKTSQEILQHIISNNPKFNLKNLIQNQTDSSFNNNN